MKLISTILFFFICLIGSAQPETDPVIISGNCWGTPGVKPGDSLPGRAATRVKLRCGNSRSFTEDRCIIIVDGDPLPFDSLSTINPDLVENISILKPAVSTALLGFDGSRGAIIITTKRIDYGRFAIKDFVSNSAIAAATVRFESADHKHRLMLPANDSGVLITDQLKPSTKYTVTVTAIGYQAYSGVFTTTRIFSKEILLSRDIKTGTGVIVTSYTRRRRGCPASRGYQRGKGKDSVITTTFGPVLKMYPDPLQRGNVLTIALNSPIQTSYNLRLISAGGQQVLLQKLLAAKGTSKFTVPTSTGWAAGLYFIDLLYENGSVAASAKIVIH